MKRKITTQFSLPSGASEQDQAIFLQLKQVTDDLKVALDNGLTFSENMRASIKTQVVNSGVEVDLGVARNATRTKGAFVLHTENAELTSFKSRTGQNGSILVTVTVSPSPASITFIVVGE